jgi:hypothetical protein
VAARGPKWSLIALPHCAGVNRLFHAAANTRCNSKLASPRWLLLFCAWWCDMTRHCGSPQPQLPLLPSFPTTSATEFSAFE